MNFIDIAHAETTEGEIQTTASHEGTSTDAGVLASLGINGQLFGFQLLNFAIVAGILWFLILKPLTQKMAERAELIDASIANAKKMEEKLAHAERAYQERVDDAKAEAGRIVEKAAVDSKVLADSMKADAKTEIEGLVDQAKKNIRSEKAEAIENIKAEAAEMIGAALEKILGDKMDATKDKKLIEDAVKKMGE